MSGGNKMKLFASLTSKEEFEGESIVNKNIKLVVISALAGIAIGVFINELILFMIFLWRFFF